MPIQKGGEKWINVKCWVVGIGMLLAVTKRDMPWTHKFITCGDDDDDHFLA